MAESQPGTVQSFDPTITLSNFTAETRDQLIFNENQLVLAKLQQARPIVASAITREGSSSLAEYSEYKNTSGKFAYIDGSFQALNTTGNPTTPVHQIVIGFDQQVTTDTIIFWSTGFVDTTYLFVEYSFDDVTWFSAGSVTWQQDFDDTIEVFPGDIPPTGEFVYTGTIDGGDITARYWRIRGDATASFSSESGSSPNKTFTVDDTTNFPSAGTLFATFGTTSRTMSYTGKTSTTFTGVDDSYTSAGSGQITAISGDNGSLTLTLDSVTNFPTIGGVVTGSDRGTSPYTSIPSFTITYDSVVASTLTGATITPDLDEIIVVTDGATNTFTTIRSLIEAGYYDADYTVMTLQIGSVLYSLYDWGSGVTEVQIIPTLSPILQHWNSDGSQAVSNSVSGKDYYSMAYDKNDDVYYALRFNDTLQGSSNIDPDDDFNTGIGSSFDSSLWTESLTNSYFQRNTSSGTLDHKSSGGDGQLSGNYGIDGDFTADIELVAILDMAEGAYFSLEAKDFSTDNVHQMSGVMGPYDPVSPTASGTFFASTMTYTDTVAGAAVLSNFRVNPTGMDFNYGGGLVDYTMTYDATNNQYNVTVSGITHPPAKPGVPYQMDSASFTISNLSTPANGQGFSATVLVSEDPMEANPLASGTALQIQRVNTNGYCRYVDSTNIGVYETTMVGNVPEDRMRIQLYGSPNGQNIDLAADAFDLTFSSLYYDTPVFSVVTIDKLGNLTQVASVSDSEGYAIKSFDVIRDPQAEYNRFLTPRSGIATNGLDQGSGGEIYIKVDDKLYKYLKSALPLTDEDGSGAAVTTTGEIPATGITNFAYNGFSGGGLSYIEYISELSGVFVRTIDSVGLTADPLKALLDVSSINHPFAWNVSDLATLYFVDGTNDLKLYDLNETKAAFVNVTSDKQVLAAGTLETATITAQVLNVYGQTKASKSMTFTVSAGDGAVSPSVGCSDGSGQDTTTYTVGSAVGTSTITVTVSDTAC